MNDVERTIRAALSDLDWAAGLFEGEGCLTGSAVSNKVGTRYWYPRVLLNMTDRDPVVRFASIVGGGSITLRKTQDGWKDCYCWAQSGWGFFDYFADLIGHRLGERRSARLAEISLMPRGVPCR